MWNKIRTLYCQAPANQNNNVRGPTSPKIANVVPSLVNCELLTYFLAINLSESLWWRWVLQGYLHLNVKELWRHRRDECNVSFNERGEPAVSYR